MFQNLPAYCCLCTGHALVDPIKYLPEVKFGTTKMSSSALKLHCPVGLRSQGSGLSNIEAVSVACNPRILQILIYKEFGPILPDFCNPLSLPLAPSVGRRGACSNVFWWARGFSRGFDLGPQTNSQRLVDEQTFTQGLGKAFHHHKVPGMWGSLERRRRKKQVRIALAMHHAAYTQWIDIYTAITTHEVFMECEWSERGKRRDQLFYASALLCAEITALTFCSPLQLPARHCLDLLKLPSCRHHMCAHFILIGTEAGISLQQQNMVI